MKIANLSAHKILASDSSDTIEVTLLLDNGSSVTASVPAGISAGQYEVKKNPPDKVLDDFKSLVPIISGHDWTQSSLDSTLSSYDIGGNATLAVSAAFFKASVSFPDTPWQPKLFLLLFEGGLHGNRNLTIQEFCVVEDTIQAAKEAYLKLKKHLFDHGIETTVGAEGAFSPKDYDNINVFNCLKELFPDKKLAVDIAASAGLFSETLAVNLDTFLRHYAFASIEDPYPDDAWDKWIDFTARHGQEILVVGDDLTVTNPERIKQAIEKKAINAVIIKPNQIGTITKAVEAVKVARDGGLKIIVSHRGEETDDYWIADFAKFVSADFVKFGGMERGERIAKYNRLLELGVT